MTTDQSGTAEPAANETEESFWSSFTRADMRLLVVTIAGTMIGAILTLALIAIAIIVARQFAKSGGLASSAAFLGEGIGALVALGLLIGWVGRRFVAPGWRGVVRGWSVIWYVGACLYALFLVLGVLGYAAGIK
jgi:hypothetical protein